MIKLRRFHDEEEERFQRFMAAQAVESGSSVEGACARVEVERNAGVEVGRSDLLTALQLK